jgi:TonB family protein
LPSAAKIIVMPQSLFSVTYSFRAFLGTLLLCLIVVSCSESPKKAQKQKTKETVVEEVQLSEKSLKTKVQPKVVPIKFVPPDPLPDPWPGYDPDPLPEPWPGPDPILPIPPPDPVLPGGPCPTYDETPYDNFQVDVQPEYPGGTSALMTFIDEHLIYPREALENGIEGRVFVRFTVLKSGETADFKVLRGLSPTIDREVIRVLKGMEKWQPGMLKNEPVDVYFTLPVKLSLD